MARYPAALWVPIGDKTTKAPGIVATCSITHSDAGLVESLAGWWTNPASGALGCHFHVSWSGRVEQYIDTGRKAVANMRANAFAISTEVSNSPGYAKGDVPFDADEYSPAQVAALIDLYRWQLDTHPTLPAQVCTDGVHGFGWHSQHAAWTLPGHACPGAARVAQLQSAVFPAVFGRPSPPAPPQEVIMSELAPAEKDLLRAASVAGKPLVFRDASTGYAYTLQPRTPLLERVTDQATIDLMVMAGMWTIGNGTARQLGTLASDAIRHLSGWVPDQ